MLVHRELETVVKSIASGQASPAQIFHWLIDYHHVEGARDFIVNHMYSMKPDVIAFIIPQLIVLYLSRSGKSVWKLLGDKAGSSIDFYLRISWCLDSWTFETRQKVPVQRARIDGLLDHCLTRMVNKIEHLVSDAQLADEHNSWRQARQDFLTDLKRLLKNLVNFSLHLKKQPAQSRKEQGRRFLNHLNGFLYRRKFSPKKQQTDKEHNFLYEGLIFPFALEPEVSSILIVRIIYSEISCFETRKRVPYRIVVETIDPEELKIRSPVYDRDKDVNGYLLMVDNDVLEEEFKFEETLTNEANNFSREETNLEYIQQEEKALMLKKFTEEKFKAENIDLEEEQKKKKERDSPPPQKKFGLKFKLEDIAKQFTRNSPPPKKRSSTRERETNEMTELKPQSVLKRSDSAASLEQTPHPTPNIRFKNRVAPLLKTLVPDKATELQKSIALKETKRFQKITGYETEDSQGIFRRRSANYFQRSFRPARSSKALPVKKSQEAAPNVSALASSVHARRYSLRFINDAKSTESKIKFIQGELLVKFRTFSPELRKRLKKYYEDLILTRSKFADLAQKREQFFKNFEEPKMKPKGYGPWELLWQYKQESIKKTSPYSDFTTYRVRQVIVKGGDDLRQEMIAMQIIKKVKEFFDREKVPAFVKTYEIIAIDSNSGMLGFVEDSISVDGLKKKYPKMTLGQIYSSVWGQNEEEAKRAFVESLAGGSILSYIMQIKDRHNGNLLIDSIGHIIHIDFGFILTIGPGWGIVFENAPFKFTQDYLTVIGGEKSPLFNYLHELITKGLIAVRKNLDELCDLLSIMATDSPLPCFEKFSMKEFRDRLRPNLPEKDVAIWARHLLHESLTSNRTVWYDDFQKMSNGIMP
jgi:disulfide oxidoreductase YuzD